MGQKFSKYQGTGNDFVMIDNRENNFNKNPEYIAKLCDRRFGIGADGLILVQNAAAEANFTMVYFNADGHESTMCGNGGRCAILFAHNIGLIKSRCTFMAIDGLHEGYIDQNGLVHLKMSDAAQAKAANGAWFIDTGSPHHVQKVAELSRVAVQQEGRDIRNTYGKAGSNVNFVEVAENTLHVRTYERGVEAETLSCGTGVTAAALTAYQQGWLSVNKIPVATPGGNLEVRFKQTENGFSDIWLSGPATHVFNGELEL